MLFLSFVLISAAAAGCACEERVHPIVVGSPAMLFDSGSTLISSTAIGRGLWPATEGPIESYEEAVFVEYFRDYQGNACQERNSPLTIFRGYRRGAQIR
jgi:hypothetical protein